MIEKRHKRVILALIIVGLIATLYAQQFFPQQHDEFDAAGNVLWLALGAVWFLA